MRPTSTFTIPTTYINTFLHSKNIGDQSYKKELFSVDSHDKNNLVTYEISMTKRSYAISI
jgi:hypothetical protein